MFWDLYCRVALRNACFNLPKFELFSVIREREAEKARFNKFICLLEFFYILEDSVFVGFVCFLVYSITKQ